MNTLLTLEEFKLFYPSSSLSDAQINLYLQLVTEFLHELAGVSLEEGEITETLRGNNSNILFLKKRPIKQIIECISSKSGDITKNITLNLANTGIVNTKGIFYQGQDIEEPYMASKTTKSDFITIKYVGGFKYPSQLEAGNVPISLKMALAGIIDSLHSNTTQEGKLKSYSRDDVSYTFKDKMETDREFYNILSRYVAW